MPDTKTPGVSITQFFPYQSYFDSTLLQGAILTQSVNQPIVNNPTTPMIKSGLGGYAVGLHPSSQTPVAFQPLVGGQSASSQAVVLRPGQIYRPHGKPGSGPGHFAGFNWGIPFGWLGGGIATLYVFVSPDSDAAWPGDAEVVFHRQRMKIWGPGARPPGGAAAFNWPQRFPWPHAVGPSAQSQAGSAVISISQPTRILMSLLLTSLPASDTMRMLLEGSNEFAVKSDGTLDTTLNRFVDYTWGSYTNEPIAGADVTNTDQNLQGAFVDVVRYGKI